MGSDSQNPPSPMLTPASSEDSLYLDYDSIEFDLPLGPSSPVLDRLVEDLSNERTKLREYVDKKRKKLRLAAKTPPIVRLKDKIAFTLGIANICQTMFMLGRFPQYFLWNYTFKLPTLISLRWWVYHKAKHHYFLLDFCYFANALLFLYLHLFPQSCTMYQLAFSYTAGPLSWAIGIWRNSMVFHSLDKITSLFIHMTPALVVWCLRWFPHSTPNHWDVCSASIENNTISFYNATVWPILPYMIWQFGYYVIVQILRRDKFKADKERMTSFRWMVHDKTHIVHRAMNVFGPKYQMWMFGILQLIYTFLTMMPVKILYENFYLHTAFLATMGMISAWNGSCFYIEVFSKRYQQSLLEQEQHYKTISQVLENEENKGGKMKSS